MFQALKKRKKEWVFWLFGFYFLILGILAFLDFFISYDIIPLWLSHISLLFIGIGILKKNSNLLAIQLNIIMIPSFLWSIDFFYHFLFGSSPLGITNYFFDSFTGSLENFISLQHIYATPIVLAFILFLGISKKTLWRWSFLEAGIVFLLSTFFSPVRSNFNCVFRPCVDFIHLGEPFYQILWFVFMFTLVYLTNYLITILAYKKRLRRSKPLKSRQSFSFNG